ncbi:Uncharacterised protein [Weissella viridescens]|uniref:Uncharacterized protein n=1 Tax=Weissella viridescens TaxID=1629 RepID=A0A380P8D5_WEIVI|nr:Uncharacterised protein [Weissella viridescens]
MGLLTRRKDELGKKMDATFQIPDLDDDNNAKDFLNKKIKQTKKVKLTKKRLTAISQSGVFYHFNVP